MELRNENFLFKRLHKFISFIKSNDITLPGW